MTVPGTTLLLPGQGHPYHLRLAGLDAHRDRLTARRVIVTHMSDDMLSLQPGTLFEPASNALAVSL